MRLNSRILCILTFFPLLFTLRLHHFLLPHSFPVSFSLLSPSNSSRSIFISPTYCLNPVSLLSHPSSFPSSSTPFSLSITLLLLLLLCFRSPIPDPILSTPEECGNISQFPSCLPQRGEDPTQLYSLGVEAWRTHQLEHQRCIGKYLHFNQ